MSLNGAEAVECEEDIGYLRKEEMGGVDNVHEEDKADGEGQHAQIFRLKMINCTSII